MKKRIAKMMSGVALTTLLFAMTGSQTLKSDLMDPEFAALAKPMHGDAILTIYQNQDLALVEDERVLELTKGVYELQLEGISGALLPNSIQMEALDSPDALLLEEQLFQSHPSDPWYMMRQHIGEEIEVFAEGGLGTYRGKLINTDLGVMIQDDQGRIHWIQDAMRFSFNSQDEDEPALQWRVRSDLQGPTPVRLRYLTQGLNWSMDYIAILDEEGKFLKIKSWVSLSNNTGLDFHLPKVNLIAGQINRVAYPEQDYAYASGQAELSPSAKLTEISHQAAFEYYEYTLDRPATLRTGETAQVAFLGIPAVPVKKSYIYEAHRLDGVQVWLAFANPQDAKPLPAGLVRIFQSGASGQRFIGEDQIGHTPVGEEVKLMTGLAFDLVSERVVLSHVRPTERSLEETIRISLTNRKSEAVSIQVRERMSGDWKILSSEIPHTKLDAETLEFSIALQPGETRIFEYTVGYQF